MQHMFSFFNLKHIVAFMVPRSKGFPTPGLVCCRWRRFGLEIWFLQDHQTNEGPRLILQCSDFNQGGERDWSTDSNPDGRSAQREVPVTKMGTSDVSLCLYFLN